MGLVNKAIIKLFVGFDPREAAAYHVFCQSVIDTASRPVVFVPLHKGLLEGFDGQQDGTNAFIYSRYLVPYLCNFTGWALFADGDMVVDRDIAELWDEQRTETYDIAVKVVKHDYQTRASRKYVGTPLENANVDYPRKNWSSLMLWNCAHAANQILLPEYVAAAGGETLHRFKWLKDKQVGELFPSWNYLVGEHAPSGANLYHYTLGIPGIRHYANDHGSWKWHKALLNSLTCAGEDPVEMVKRSQDRVGA